MRISSKEEGDCTETGRLTELSFKRIKVGYLLKLWNDVVSAGHPVAHPECWCLVTASRGDLGIVEQPS
jgi:hypothetical protein